MDSNLVYDKAATAEGEYTLGYSKSPQQHVGGTLPRTPVGYSARSPTGNTCPHNLQRTDSGFASEGVYATRDPRLVGNSNNRQPYPNSHLYESPQFRQ